MEPQCFENGREGLQAVIMAGNDKNPFRVVMRDADADATVMVRFVKNYGDAMGCVDAFLMGHWVQR